MQVTLLTPFESKAFPQPRSGGGRGRFCKSPGEGAVAFLGRLRCGHLPRMPQSGRALRQAVVRVAAPGRDAVGSEGQLRQARRREQWARSGASGRQLCRVDGGRGSGDPLTVPSDSVVTCAQGTLAGPVSAGVPRAQPSQAIVLQPQAGQKGAPGFELQGHARGCSWTGPRALGVSSRDWPGTSSL